VEWTGSGWQQVYTFEFTVQVQGRRPLGRFRVGKALSFGPYGVSTLAAVTGEGTVVSTDFAADTVTIAYDRTATSKVRPDRIRMPAPRVSQGEHIELLPHCRWAKLGSQFDFSGPAPPTHVVPPDGSQIMLRPSTAAPCRLPKDLR
jgi:hypothetical protein